MVHVFDIKAGRPLTYALDIMHLREVTESILQVHKELPREVGLSTDIVSFSSPIRGQHDACCQKHCSRRRIRSAASLELEIGEDEEGAELEETEEDANAQINLVRHIKCSAHRLQNSVKNVFERKGSEFLDSTTLTWHNEIGGEDQACAYPPSALHAGIILQCSRLRDSTGFNECASKLDWRYADGTPMRISEADADAMNVFIEMLDNLALHDPVARRSIPYSFSPSTGLNSMLRSL
uniref:Uncharacterized protein n=1 Tax=Ditylenchus dipsaci TaxID=166011 RepID=A0A915EJ84_9BILA